MGCLTVGRYRTSSRTLPQDLVTAAIGYVAAESLSGEEKLGLRWIESDDTRHQRYDNAANTLGKIWGARPPDQPDAFELAAIDRALQRNGQSL